MPKLLVVANAASGAPAKAQARATAIRAAFRACGQDARVSCVPGERLADACAEAVANRVERLVVAGGDGTISAAAGAVAGTPTALAVLPLGTMNHFAKDAGIPLDLEAAAAHAVAGRIEAVDVAEVNGRVFVNNTSIGLYPEAVRERDRRMAAGGSKRLAMVRAAGTVLMHAPTHHLLLSLDGQPAVRTTSFLFIGNNAYETGLAGLGTRASLTGGRLSVYTSRRPGRRAMLGLAARTLLGRLKQAPDFEAGSAREVVVHADRHALRVGVDGEVCTLDLPLRFTVRPKALRLVRGT